MTLDLNHPAIARTHPHLRRLLTAAGERALALHSDEVVPEHLLHACMQDEDCAANQLVQHAFADPETVAFELAALCPGLMVVGSKAALPFSTRSVEALYAARATAVAAGANLVESGVLLAAAHAALPEEVRADLRLDDAALEPTPGAGELPPDGPLFRCFSGDAKRALSQANKAAHSRGETSIGPAQLLLACLAADTALAQACGVSSIAARERLDGRTTDSSPPPDRELAPSPALMDLLGTLPEDADSLAFLSACQHGASDELSALLERHKISASLLQRAAGAFQDPTSC